MLDTVPWFVGHPGAQHSAESARMLAYMASGGREGIVSAADMRVSALPVPGSAVVVQPGAVAVLNRAAGQQTYIARVVEAENVAIAATGSGGGRTDLICAIIRDPSQPGGGNPPADPVVGPYWAVEVVSGVPAGTTRLQSVTGHANTTGYALARVTLPANTGTVTASHITDLRALANPGQYRDMELGYATTQVTISSTAFTRIPADGDQAWFDCPAWATDAIVRVDMTLAQEGTSQAWGEWAIRMELEDGTESAELAKSAWDTGDDDDHRKDFSVLIAQKVQIPPAFRGRRIRVLTSMRRSGGTGTLRTKTTLPIVTDVEFSERL